MARPVTLGSSLADLSATLPGSPLVFHGLADLHRALQTVRAEVLSCLREHGVTETAAALGVHRATVHAWRAPGGWLYAPAVDTA